MEVTKGFADSFIVILPWIMGTIFALGCFVRFMMYYTVKRHEWFAREFERRVSKFMESETPGDVADVSFYSLAKRILERAYYESFEMRDRKKLRTNDPIMTLSDRVFLVKQGCAWLVKDILKQLKFLKWTKGNPKLLNITKSTFQHNPCFNRIFGVLPIASVNDVVSILPGLFVVAGILGTFIGISKGLPELGGMNMNDLDNTKNIMDRFLNEIAFAMHSSIFGISFSLVMHMWNTVFSPERVYVSMVDSFESSLDLLWYRADNNNYPKNEGSFDEHKDPIEALAEKAVNQQVEISLVKKAKAS